MKKIVVSPDSFKGGISSLEFCEIVKAVLCKYYPDYEIKLLPLSDGGENFTLNLVRALNGEIKNARVTGPYFEKVNASWGWLEEKKIAVIDMAAASGLELTKIRKTKEATTYGTGELIREAVEFGAREIIIGIGGSATTDGGAGMAAALGCKFYDENGDFFIPVGRTLNRISSFDFSSLDYYRNEITITVVRDVENPLYGPCGAACVYSPQKGIEKGDMALLDDNLKFYSGILGAEEIALKKGAGAAGGLGFALDFFLNGNIEKGIDYYLELIDYDQEIKNSSFIITGEGKMDDQTLEGKVIMGVARRAAFYHVPLVVFCGVNELYDEKKGLLPGNVSVFTIIQKVEEENMIISKTKEWLYYTAEQVFRFSKTLLK